MPFVTFTPPTQDIVPPVAFDVPPLANRLGRYLHNRPRGRNVWQLDSNGLSTQFSFDQPWPTIENTGANRASLFADEPAQIGRSTSNLIEVTYERLFAGGSSHILRIDTTSQVLVYLALLVFLNDAGYTGSDYIEV